MAVIDKLRKDCRFDLISFGRVGVDLYALETNRPLSQVDSFAKYLGGSPANISVGASRLGLKTALFSKVGDDDMGGFLLDTLQKEGVDLGLMSRSAEHLTALAMLGINPPDNFPLIFFRNDCADMQLDKDDLKPELIQSCRFFQFSGTGLSSASMLALSLDALQLAKAAKALIVFDLDYRPVLWGKGKKGDGETRYLRDSDISSCYQKALPFVDILVGTEEELLIASGKETIDEAIRYLRDNSTADIVYKKGLAGSEVHLYQGGDVIHCDAFKVAVFNTLGAGDAYLSALLYGLIYKEDWLSALSLANASGAIVATRHGCSPAMPRIDELEFFIDNYQHLGEKVITSPILQQLPAKASNSPLIVNEDGFADGLTPLVSVDDHFQTGMNFQVLRLKKGETFPLTSPLETAALLMTGEVSFNFLHHSQTVFRGSYFDDAPFVLHTSADTDSHVVALSDAELLIMQTDNEAEFAPMLFDEQSLLDNDRRGKGLLDDVSYRLVRTVFDKRNREASNLVVGEIITFQGHWSSCPPHYHPQPEIYHYRFSEPSGFAFAEDGDKALKVHHNDTLVIQDEKTHAHASAPGYALYTLWFIRHLENAPYIVPNFKEVHDWTRYPSANHRVWRP